MVEVSYDPEADALYLLFHKGEVTSRELSEHILADYDAQGRLAGIEVLCASRQLGVPLPSQPVEIEAFRSA